LALTHLLDTSVLTRLHAEPVRTVVAELAADARGARAGITDLEIGYSARSAAEWDRLTGALAILGLIETDAAHVRRARQVQRLLASKSQRGRMVPDLLVAAAAEQEGLVVLHYDADFDRIASLTGQSCEWVVPAGSID
jgi:predicted nucleic acid-binding protein